MASSTPSPIMRHDGMLASVVTVIWQSIPGSRDSPCHANPRLAQDCCSGRCVRRMSAAPETASGSHAGTDPLQSEAN